VTPGSTTAVRSTGSIDTMRSIRVKASTMPPRAGTAPAARLLPAPRGTTGMRRSFAHRRTRDTSSAFPGRTIADGIPEKPNVAPV
jgi:hypothetical protein